MDRDRFDDLARELFTASSRRALLRGMLAGSGGMAALTGRFGAGDAVGRARKKRGGKPQGCTKARQCKRPENPCETVACRRRRCRRRAQPDGTSCGEGRACFEGICTSTCDPAGPPCDRGLVCCAALCVDTSSSAAHCGACGVRCDPLVSDGCAGGSCVCGGNPACAADQICDAGTCACGPRYEAVDDFGGSGSAPGQVAGPTGVAVDGTDTVYVADAGNDRLQALARDGSSIASIEIDQPWGVAVAPTSGVVYVGSSTALGSLTKVSRDGDALFESWKRDGTEINGPGQLAHVRGVAVDDEGNIYAADSGNLRIVKYSAEGNFLGEWDGVAAGGAEAFEPFGLATSTASGSVSVYAADPRNDRVREFTATGEPVRALGGQGSERGKMRAPRGVATDSAGAIYVADSGNDRIQKFAPTGEVVRVMGKTGTERGTFNQPLDAALDAVGNVFITDNGNDRVQVFAPRGGDPPTSS